MTEPDPIKPYEENYPPGMSAPSLRALAHAGYTRLEELDGVSERALAKLHGMGPKGLRILRAALAEKGLAFKA